MIAYAGWCRRDRGAAQAAADRGEAALAARRADAARHREDKDDTWTRSSFASFEVETIIGFWEWERRIKQIVSIDLEIAHGRAHRRRAATASPARLNYEQLAKRLIEFVGASQYQMVEALATAIGAHRRSASSARRGSRCRSRSPARFRRRARSASSSSARRGLCLTCSSGPAATPIPSAAAPRASPSSSGGSARCAARASIAAPPSGAPAAGLPEPRRRVFERTPASTRCAQSCARSRRSRAGRAPIPPSARSTSTCCCTARASTRSGGCRGRACSALPFVLAPLAELAPELVHPVTGERCARGALEPSARRSRTRRARRRCASA